eukprot:scaffold7328_cov314-Pinguiococcus_pyrenoidosus.AAC.74
MRKEEVQLLPSKGHRVGKAPRPEPWESREVEVRVVEANLQLGAAEPLHRRVQIQLASERLLEVNDVAEAGDALVDLLVHQRDLRRRADDEALNGRRPIGGEVLEPLQRLQPRVGPRRIQQSPAPRQQPTSLRLAHGARNLLNLLHQAVHARLVAQRCLRSPTLLPQLNIH